MPRPEAAAVVAVLLTAACTGTTTQTQSTLERMSPASSTPPPSAALSQRASSAPSTASPSPTRERVSVSSTDVAGVPVGTAGDEAERKLTEALGPPVAEALPGCYGESGRSLTWGALTAYLSDGAEGGAAVLRGWVVTSGPNSQRIALPYETAVGQTTDEVMSRVPAAEGEAVTEGPYAESFLVTTPRSSGLLWRADAKGGLVDEVAYEAEVCD
jgi:hypothetical protein